MEQQKSITALVSPDARLSKVCSTIDQALIEEHGWGELVEAGKFNAEKALCCLEVTKKEYLRSLKPRTVEEAIRCNTPELSSMRKYRGEVKMNAVIHALIYELKDFFSVGRGMSDSQVEVLSDLIFEHYYWMTIAELKHFTRQAMAGKFGKVYDRLDGALVMEWLQGYAGEVLETRRAMQHLAETEQKEEKSAGLPKWFTDKVDAILERWEQNKRFSKSTFQFVSLNQYCEISGVDLQEIMEDIDDQAAIQFEALKPHFPDLEITQILQKLKAEKLAEINREWAAGKIIENDKSE